jgi:prophage DNA circulation protein
MSYLDSLRKGSFRGFEFFVESVQTAGGRRAVQHQFPNRETPYTEDLGRQAKSYSIDGHIIGQDYLETKTRLFEVFEKKGPGELIHPFYGSLMVQVSSLNVSESIKQGAIATFSCTFLELGDPKFPKGTNDKGAILSENVDESMGDIKGDFDDDFSVDGMPGFSIDSARALVAKAQQTFDDVTKPLADAAEGIADLAFATRNLIAEVDDLLQSPSLLSQRLLDSFSLMENAISGNKDKTKAYSAFYSFEGDDVVEETTPTRIREAKNKSVFENFMRRAASVQSAKTASVSEFVSIDEAHEAREKITAVIEEQIREIEINDPESDLYQSMIDVNASIVDALPDVDADLPSIKTITPEKDEISLLLAYDLNESLDNEQDIIDRNGIRNPAFVAAQKSLEVIGGN